MIIMCDICVYGAHLRIRSGSLLQSISKVKTDLYPLSMISHLLSLFMCDLYVLCIYVCICT